MIKSIWNFNPKVTSREMVKKYFAIARLETFVPRLSTVEGKVCTELVSDRVGGEITLVLKGERSGKESFDIFKPTSNQYIDFRINDGKRIVGNTKKFNVYPYAGIGGGLLFIGADELFFKNVILFDKFDFRKTVNCIGVVTIATDDAKGKIVVRESNSLVIGHYTSSGKTFKCNELDVQVGSDMMIETVNGCRLKAKRLTIRVPDQTEFTTKELEDALSIMGQSESVVVTSHDPQQLIELASKDTGVKVCALLKTGIETAPYMMIGGTPDLIDFIADSPNPEKIARFNKFLMLTKSKTALPTKFTSYIDLT